MNRRPDVYHKPSYLLGKRALLSLLVFFGVRVSTLAAGRLLPHAVVHPLGSSSSAPATQDERCASCHADIYSRYESTAMARGSGRATAGFLPGAFHHNPSDVDYRVFLRDGAAWMSFRRSGATVKGSLNGERKLEYFVGSGRRGRTFLYQVGGQWFELPINYYTRRDVWDMAPNYSNSTLMPSPLPTDAGCLHCHATDVANPLPEARNRFAGAPFGQGGVGCTACHGDATEHLAHAGHGAIVNPGKLPVERRDSSCIQCHLEGNAVVYKPGRSLSQFRAGDDLRDIAVYFVYASQAAGGSRATSQYEALLQSACKRASGDTLTCTTCHDPHGSPTPAERVAYFRGRCLSCHTTPALATKHHPEQPDCAACHMHTRETSDITHEQVTDHNIERYPATQIAAKRVDGETLVPVGDFPAAERDLGLAYAQLAQLGDRKAGERALALLKHVEASAGTDEQLHLNLGFLHQVSGSASEARSEYVAALQAQPFEPAALSNLAVLDATSGRPGEAVQLLQRLVKADPSQTIAGLNLAFLECKLGHVDEAREVAERVLRLNPDSEEVRLFLRSGTYAGQSCASRTADAK